MPIQLPPYDPSQTPVGFDTADGLGGRPGTPTPFNQLFYNGQQFSTVEELAASIGIESVPESPQVERAEQATCQQTFRLPIIEAFTRQRFLGRGAIYTDSYNLTWRVLSCTVKSAAAGMAEMTVTMESISFDTPPDEFDCRPVELSVNLIKHPRYLYALIPDPSDTSDIANVKRNIVRQIQFYQSAPTPYVRQFIENTLKIYTSVDSLATQYAKAAAQEIIQKLWLQFDNPYLVGYKINWRQYFWRPPFINPGGYVQDPIADGILPSYFGSPSGDYAIDTIFDHIATINPQSYAAPNGDLNISCLRLSDELTYNRTWFAVDKTWLVAPIGHWDAQLYNRFPRPNQAFATNTPFPYQVMSFQ